MLAELQDHVLVLTLNRPERRNALSLEMCAIWTEQIRRARKDEAVRAVVVTGAGESFCSGADFTMIGEKRERPTGHTPFDHFAHEVAIALDELDKPVIAAVNGAAVGAGLAMALMPDLRFLSDRAKLSEGYINVGLFPGDGDTYYLPRLVGASRALMMMWTGDFFDAQECLSMGLADRIFPHDELMPRTLEFAHRLTTRSQIAVRSVKRAVYANAYMSLRDSLGMIAAFGEVAGKSPEQRVAFEQYMKERAARRGRPG